MEFQRPDSSVPGVDQRLHQTREDSNHLFGLHAATPWCSLISPSRTSVRHRRRDVVAAAVRREALASATWEYGYVHASHTSDLIAQAQREVDDLLADDPLIVGTALRPSSTSISPSEAAALRRLVERTGATRTIEIGLGFGKDDQVVVARPLRGDSRSSSKSWSPESLRSAEGPVVASRGAYIPGMSGMSVYSDGSCRGSCPHGSP